jgi:hypothetical protein
VCPVQSRGTFSLCRRLVAVDGTFLKARFILTLLLAVGIDANGENVLLAWAVVESENRDSWEWFFQHLRWSIPEISLEESTLISDRDKGLQEAERTLGRMVMVAWCCHHLKENFTEKFGRRLAPLFWKAARAPTRVAFEAVLDSLRTEKPEAAAYLLASEPEKWAESMFRGRRYAHDTSNIVESLNKTLLSDRELPIVELLDAIWHRVMAARGERLAAANKLLAAGHNTTPFVDGVVSEGRGWAQGNICQVSSPSEARVIQPDGRIFLVDLAGRTCSCRKYQANGIPCGHAMALIFARGDQISPYLPNAFSAAQWAAQFEAPMPPVDVSELEVIENDPCEPPITRVPRGRPKKERFRKEAARRRVRRAGEIGIEVHGLEPLPPTPSSRCRTCGETGHNARTCRRPHN